MDARSIVLLEFPELRERLVAATAFEPSRRLAAALEPTSDPVLVTQWLDQTDEARALASERPGVGIGAARDMGPAVERAARQGRLEPAQLLDVAVTLEATTHLVEALAEDPRPLLRGLVRRLSPLPHVRGRLEQSVDPAGELLDTASPALGGLRRQVRITYERLRTRLEELVHSSTVGPALQEPIVTLRNGRYVVPVRAEARSRVRGIVHDQSGSGQTLFVEPLVAVELGNRWREAQLAVQAEEERILDELSALVGGQAPALRATLGALADFDFWAAKARLAAELDGVRAETVADARGGAALRPPPGPERAGRADRRAPRRRLHGAGHHRPQHRRQDGGPADGRPAGADAPGRPARPGRGRQPAAGLPRRARRHRRRAVGGAERSPRSAATCARSSASSRRPGRAAWCCSTSWARAPTRPRARRWPRPCWTTSSGPAHWSRRRPTTPSSRPTRTTRRSRGTRRSSSTWRRLSPTYRLSIGLPGTSQAFAIAERLGLPAELVDDARSRLSRAQQEFETTLASIKASQATAAEATARARVAEARAVEARQAAEMERARARRERDDAVMSAPRGGRAGPRRPARRDRPSAGHDGAARASPKRDSTAGGRPGRARRRGPRAATPKAAGAGGPTTPPPALGGRA